MNHRYAPGPRLYRDVDRRWIAGVLAGASAHFGWHLGWMRVLVMAACVTPLVPLVAIVYVLCAVFLPAHSNAAMGPPPAPAQAAAADWQPAPPAHVSAGELRTRIREMEERLRAMEAYVTSSKYEIDRELKRGP